MAQDEFSGLWRSHFKYHSSSRHGEFDVTHIVRMHHKDNQLIVETEPGHKDNDSYLLMRLSLDDNIATGNWHEETDRKSYYKGAVYHGAIQMIVAGDKKHMEGKWVGFGTDLAVNVGPWELTKLNAEESAKLANE